MVVGFAEYLRKGPPDIFIYDIYAEVVHAYDEIHKAVYIIICALVRVFYLGRYFMQAIYYVIIETLSVPKRQIK